MVLLTQHRDGSRRGLALRRPALPAVPLFVLVTGLVALGACGDAGPLDGTQLSSVAECLDRGGAPLFDPDDGRPVQLSCPEGLRFIGTFDEPFFGSDGGLCCTGVTDDEAGDERP